MPTAIALFTRDLRVHDNPMLTAAARAAQVVPLFVLDSAITTSAFAAPARMTFLAESLADLDASLQSAAGRLVVREGALVAEVCRVVTETGATEVHLSADVSGYAQRRQARLAEALAPLRCELRVHDEVVTAIAPGRIRPSGRDSTHFAVFTPYFRRWAETSCRALATAPRRLNVPDLAGKRPEPADPLPAEWLGGESAGRDRAARWYRTALAEYEDNHDDLAADRTSRLSPYLHFGCLSPLELLTKAARARSAGAEAFVRQLCWRDFHHQLLAARPEVARADYRTHHDRWRTDEQALRAWQDGRTGLPIVDAGMRQLRAENWMHNRARLITGSFLTKSLYLDWRAGADHFADHLLDADVANNNLNWQWVAGTGTDSRPNRVLNPLRQAERYDADGAYVRRWVPELAQLSNKDIHQPWRLGPAALRHLDYPPPIVDLDEARQRFHANRGGSE